MDIYVLPVWFCFTMSILTAATQPTDPSEVNALVDIKKTLIDPMDRLSNWNKGDPCLRNWTGIWCFDRVGKDGYYHVRELYLMNMNLSGSIAPQLGQLTHLQTMNLMWNNLTGSIPKEIGNITSLKLLLLNGNSLSGNLPDELGYLANLSRLQIDQNQLSGPIPESFSNLNNVRHIHMNNNSFSGQIPHKLSKLSKLLHLLVDNNNLSGYLPPEFSMLSGLRILQLDNNNFSGTEIPSTYVKLSTLVKLSLRNCSLQGTVPDFSSIPDLSYLDLSWNHLSGPIPSNKLADNMTTIDLSNNNLNGSIPRSFSYLPLLQKLSLENNFLSGPVPTSIWQNMSFSMNAKLAVDLRNNSLSNFSGILNPPANVTLRLASNPICKKNAKMQNIRQYCGTAEIDKGKSKNSRVVSCPVQSCPLDNFYEYVPAASSPIPCFCASPLRIGYQLKSPSFSYFPPYMSSFELYVTQSLNLNLYQLSIYSYAWEEGPRLSMYLKIFPSFNDSGQYSSVFNSSEVRRILSIFTSWRFHRNDFFGPYELLNITLLGPYANMFIGSQRSKINAGILIAAIIAAVACVLVISALVTLVITKRHIKYKHKLSASNNVSIRIDGMKAFTFKELALATYKFSSSNRVGKGGYGNVYKGTLSDDTTVAIKRAEEGSLQGQKEFLTEIELLSRLHHRNLVSLIGFCNEKGEQMLVYEFMPNGTLRDWISGKNKSKESLDFGMRLRIAMGSARGILYLHTEANPPIFHRDIKASNILLDSKFTAKVADFGLSRLAPCLDDEGTVPNHVSTVVRGTPGYLDPEYLLTHKLTAKSDVYSLGIVFLELLTGMKPISHGKNIVREVHVAHESGVIHSIIDSRIMGCGCYPSDCVDNFLSLALSCCHDNPEERPSMLDVVRELENILQLLQETETTFSDATSENSGKLLAPPSSSASACNESMEGSNLVSGVIPTIVPR